MIGSLLFRISYGALLCLLGGLLSAAGCSRPPVEVQFEEEQPVVLKEIWGSQWFQGEIVTSVASSPGDSLLVSIWQGDESQIVKTGDMGASWNVLGEGTTTHSNGDRVALNIVSSESPGRLFASYNYISRYLATSDDGGHTWNTIDGILGFRAILRLDEGRYLIGSTAGEETVGGAWLYTNIAGIPETLEETYLDPSFSVVSLLRLKNGDIMAATAVSGIYVSRDNASTFESSSSGIEPGFYRVLAQDTDTGRVYAGTTTGLYVSNDSGLSWHKTAFDIVRYLPMHVLVADANRVIVLAEQNLISYDQGGAPSIYILFTEDAGNSWSEIEAPPEESLRGIYLTPSNYLLTLTNNGVYPSKNKVDALVETAFR